jgi:hypothetical protein
MALVKETASCAPDSVLDTVPIQQVTATAQTIDARTVRLVKFPFLFAGTAFLLAEMILRYGQDNR